MRRGSIFVLPHLLGARRVGAVRLGSRTTLLLSNPSQRQRPREYTTEEVLGALRSADVQALGISRLAAIRACAAEPSRWIGRLEDRPADELGRLGGLLPKIVFWYAAGLSLEEIGRRVGHFGELSGVWEAERALLAAARCIARQLNHSRPAGV